MAMTLHGLCTTGTVIGVARYVTSREDGSRHGCADGGQAMDI
jgi:hypothetical protein